MASGTLIKTLKFKFKLEKLYSTYFWLGCPHVFGGAQIQLNYYPRQSHFVGGTLLLVGLLHDSECVGCGERVAWMYLDQLAAPGGGSTDCTLPHVAVRVQMLPAYRAASLHQPVHRVFKQSQLYRHILHNLSISS